MLYCCISLISYRTKLTLALLADFSLNKSINSGTQKQVSHLRMMALLSRAIGNPCLAQSSSSFTKAQSLWKIWEHYTEQSNNHQSKETNESHLIQFRDPTYHPAGWVVFNIKETQYLTSNTYIFSSRTDSKQCNLSEINLIPGMLFLMYLGRQSAYFSLWNIHTEGNYKSLH